MHFPEISVVVPTYNRADHLPRLLNALVQQTLPKDRFELILVDDGSKSPIAPIAEEYATRIALKCLRQPNAGPAAARNAGIAVATGMFIAFTDDDCAPDSDWLANFVRALAEFPDAMVGGAVRNGVEGALASEAAQMVIDNVYRFYNRNPLQAHFFASNNMACSAELLRALNGFDENFRCAEDRNLCDRWRLAGRRLVFTPEAKVAHFHRLNVASFVRMYFAYGRGALRFHSYRALNGAGSSGELLAFYGEWKRRDAPYACSYTSCCGRPQMRPASCTISPRNRPTVHVRATRPSACAGAAILRGRSLTSNKKRGQLSLRLSSGFSEHVTNALQSHLPDVGPRETITHAPPGFAC
jgi:glycosyltransferase involved in cell wall biosynthesis